jgi:hypothetical protein
MESSGNRRNAAGLVKLRALPAAVGEPRSPPASVRISRVTGFIIFRNVEPLGRAGQLGARMGSGISQSGNLHSAMLRSNLTQRSQSETEPAENELFGAAEGHCASRGVDRVRDRQHKHTNSDMLRCRSLTRSTTPPKAAAGSVPTKQLVAGRRPPLCSVLFCSVLFCVVLWPASAHLSFPLRTLR